MSDEEKIKKAIDMSIANLKVEDDFPIEEEKNMIEKTKAKIKTIEVNNGRYMG